MALGELNPVVIDPSIINHAGFSTPQLPNHGWKVFLALVTMIILSGLFVVARISTRVATRQMGPDDYTIVIALASCIVQTTMWALSVRTGYGADYLRLDAYHRQTFNKWWFLGNVFYPITIAMFKTSVILLNKRIFVQRGFQKLCWVALAVNGCWALGNWLGMLLQCIPIPIMWGVVPLSEGRCFNQRGLWMSIVAWDVSSDVMILGMAIPMVWKVNLRVREKIMLTLLFMLGAVVTIFSILSCSAVASSLQKDRAKQANKYTYAMANLFQVLESNMGIIGACLPVMRQPLRQYLPWLFGSSKSRGYTYSEDRFDNPYPLRDVSDRPKDGGQETWHKVSITGPDLYKSTKRNSDELHIIHETMENADEEGSGDSSSARSQLPCGIRRDVSVSVSRV